MRKPKRIIDFRCRPQTAEYMNLYQPEVFGLFSTSRPADLSIDQFIQAMDDAGIALGVFTGRNTPANGPIEATIVDNDYIAECVAKSRGKLLGFGGIAPLQKVQALKDADYAIDTLGLSGLSADMPGMAADRP